MNIQSTNVTILGTGAWGSTLGKIIEKNRYQVYYWSRRQDTSLAATVEKSSILISAIAMQGVKPTITQLKAIGISSQTIIVTATKGLDLSTTQTPSQLWQATFPSNPVVVLSGPNLSAEINQQLPAATVVASKNLTAAQTTQKIFASDNLRVYLNNDPLGTELGGSLKNVMAIAAGVCDGMQLGINAKAALLTRALPEMIRIGTYLGGKAETFFGLSGLGDLIATCDSALSRNYQVGYGLAQGKSLEDILEKLPGTAEGVNTTQVLHKIAHTQANLSLPITQQVYLLLTGKITPTEAVSALMQRDLKSEF